MMIKTNILKARVKKMENPKKDEDIKRCPVLYKEKECLCPSLDLFRFGCKCGAVISKKRELEPRI